MKFIFLPLSIFLTSLFHAELIYVAKLMAKQELWAKEIHDKRVSERKVEMNGKQLFFYTLDSLPEHREVLVRSEFDSVGFSQYEIECLYIKRKLRLLQISCIVQTDEQSNKGCIEESYWQVTTYYISDKDIGVVDKSQVRICGKQKTDEDMSRMFGYQNRPVRSDVSRVSYQEINQRYDWISASIIEK